MDARDELMYFEAVVADEETTPLPTKDEVCFVKSSLLGVTFDLVTLAAPTVPELFVSFKLLELCYPDASLDLYLDPVYPIFLVYAYLRS